ncbi:MAG: PRC-barrel domain-containing protein [Alphaproteobacteria bacterium]|nr:PRC-barrel domain-containing protein [Alphaproteobacteria bacterium]
MKSGIRIIMAAVGATALAGAAAAAPHDVAEGTQIAMPNHQSVAARDNVHRYYGAHQLIGSHVLNLSGERIGQVSNLVIDDAGKIKQVLIALKDSLDMDGAAVPVAPHRAEIVSVEGAQITIIRVNMTREELVQAQLTRLKTNARAPVERETGWPVRQHLVDPLF